MKKNEISIGKVYLVTVSGKRSRVRLTAENPNGGYDGLNIDTKRKVRVKTAGRLQREITDPDAPQEAQEQRVASDEPTSEGDDQPQSAPEAAQDASEPAMDQEPNQPAEPASDDDKPLSKLSVDELRDRYVATLQRPTKSRSRSYLQWKIRQAEKGKVPVGPRKSRAGEPKDCKVLPLRMETELVTQLDNARERLGLKSRMELFRRALHAYLDGQGEGEVAALFATEV